jgi:putative ABC transport system permease protein
MNEIMQTLQAIAERGLIFGLVSVSVYLSSRLLTFDNLSVEGAFCLGGAVMAALLQTNINPWVSLLLAMILGGLTGVLTGLLHTKLKLNALISGVVITTGLFSICLKVAGSTLTLSKSHTIFNFLQSLLEPVHGIALLLVVSSVVIFVIFGFLKTEIGFLLQTVGQTPQVLTNLGKSVDGYILLGLMLSNMVAALSGGLFVQYTGYFSIWSSIGVLIIGLAGMILAELIDDGFGFVLLFGSILYQTLISMTFELQLDQDLNKLMTALLIIVLIAFKPLLHKLRSSHDAV